MQRSSLIALIVIVVVLLLAAGTTLWVVQQQHASEHNTDAAKTLDSSTATPYTDLSGQPFSFADFHGQVRVVNSFASWSPYAVKELPILNQLAAAYASQGVVFIAVDRKEEPATVKAFLRTVGDVSGVHIAIDTTDAFYRSIGGYAMPETVIYDANGHIVSHERGAFTKAQLAQRIDQVLNGAGQ